MGKSQGDIIASFDDGSGRHTALDTALHIDEYFRRDLAAASAKDPPATMSAVGDLAGWLLQQVGELKRAKQRSVEVARQHGNAHPSKLRGDAAAEELAAYNYASGCMLDVESYRQAVHELGEESEVVEKHWRELHTKFVANLLRMHQAMQQINVAFWEPANHVGSRRTGIGLQKLSLLPTRTGET